VEDLLNKKVVNSYFCSQVLHRFSIPTFTEYIELQDGTLKRLVGLMDCGNQSSLIRKGSIRNANKEIIDNKVLRISGLSAKTGKTSRYNIAEFNLC
jgi:hypothetical protein